ncbi:Tripartite tricarboxylate transporter family receptor [compost metagenome]
MPRAIVDKVNRELNRVLQLPDVTSRFAQLGLDIEGGTPSHFSAFIQGEAKKLSALVRSGAVPAQ